jgi:ribonuclease Z
VCITHFHGDHCLGLAGVIQRLSLDRCGHPVAIHYPASGQQYFDRLRYASIYSPSSVLEPRPIAELNDGMIVLAETDRYVLYAHALDHGVPAYGYRIEERMKRKFLPDKLAAARLSRSCVAELVREGSIRVGRRMVMLDDVSVVRRGAVFAFVMDTRPCVGALALARDADLLVMEATYLEAESHLAEAHGHTTASGAAHIAREAGAHMLAITHCLQRYSETEGHLTEAREIFRNTVSLNDLDRIEILRRR